MRLPTPLCAIVLLLVTLMAEPVAALEAVPMPAVAAPGAPSAQVVSTLSGTAAATPQTARPAPSAIATQAYIAPPPPPPTLLRIELPEDPPKLGALDLTAPPDDLLDRMRNGFSMPNLDSAQVAERQAWYLNRPDQVREMLERSRRYLHHIVSEIEKRGMPMELALLPMVESAFNPMAQSPAQASGLWQFIPSTGRNYNLAQNFWVDQRRDIIASTSAALDYLQTIYEMHGDWHLALASYNWGENAVARAIQKNQALGLPTDYSSLNMPAETRYYVPKLQALKNIIAQPQVFGIVLPKIPNRAYFATVETRGSMDIATAARLANMSMAEFAALNPAYNRPLLPHQGGGSILIPAQNVDQYFANLESHDKPLANWATHTVSRNERIDTIAAKYNIPAGRLRQINGLSPKSKLGPGQTLLVPTGGQIFPADPPVARAAGPAPRKATKPVAQKHPTARRANAKVAKKSAHHPKPVAKRNIKAKSS